jgi:hypothetical protein
MEWIKKNELKPIGVSQRRKRLYDDEYEKPVGGEIPRALLGFEPVPG